MKTLAVIIAVDFHYFEDIAIKAILKYYGYFGVPVEVLKENHPLIKQKEASPSWNKVFLHDMFEADFIIGHDLDLLPCNLKYDILDFINPEYFNMCHDQTIIGKHYMESACENYFRYNGWLIGYPKKYSWLGKDVFNIWDKSKYESIGEQYPLNERLGNEGIYVNILPQLFNRFYSEDIDYSKTAFCHYTRNVTTLNKRQCILDHHPQDMLI